MGEFSYAYQTFIRGDAFKQINQYRHYNPSTGRFLSIDPKGFAAGDTNFYRYVGNNPIRFSDPFGLDYSICNRPLHMLPGSEELMSNDPTISHTYVKFDDGSTISYGPAGEINEGGASCSKAAGGRSNKSQEQKMKDWARRNYNKDYSLFNYNCKDFAGEALLNGF